MRIRTAAIVLALAVALVMIFIGPGYGGPTQIPADRIVRGAFIDYVNGRGPAGTGENNTTFKYKGIHWANPEVHYEVNATGSGLATSTATGAVDSGFSSWQNEYNDLSRLDTSNITYVDDGSTTGTGPVLDGHNTVSWAPQQSGVLAATYYWYDRKTKDLIEFDMVFSTGVSWSTTGDSTKYDVWDITTHEAGHTLQLGDLYSPRTSELTMYGIGAPGETKKQTLGLGDMLGVEKIYPSP